MALEDGLDRHEPPQAGEGLVEVREADRWRRLSVLEPLGDRALRRRCASDAEMMGAS
jgi:hypothetical protein